MQILIITSKSTKIKNDVKSLISMIEMMQKRKYMVKLTHIQPSFKKNIIDNNETFILSNGHEVEYYYGYYERYTDIILSKDNFIDIDMMISEGIIDSRNVVDNLYAELNKKIQCVNKKPETLHIIYCNVSKFNVHKKYVKGLLKRYRDVSSKMDILQIGIKKSEQISTHINNNREPKNVASYFLKKAFMTLISITKLNYILFNYIFKNIGNFQIEKKTKPDNKNELILSKNKSNVKTINQCLIVIVGVQVDKIDSYCSVIDAINFSEIALGISVEIKQIEASDIARQNEEVLNILKQANGILIPGGFGEDGAEGKILAIEYARKNQIPFLGICLGFQMAAVEFARNVLNLKTATSEEFNINTDHKIVRFMNYKKTDKFERPMRMGTKLTILDNGSKLAKIYQSTLIIEKYHHGYCINLNYEKMFKEHGLYISGTNKKFNITGSLEIRDHPFFIGVQYHPEYITNINNPHPLFVEFLKAVYKQCKF